VEAVLDDPGARAVVVAAERQMPVGVRPRQLSLRTLLVGILLAIADDRPAHLTRVHRQLVGLPEADRRRLGVTVRWRTTSHLLSYRQVERTFSLLLAVLGRAAQKGTAPVRLQELLDVLLEASIEARFKKASRSLAVDWTDVETFARPVPKGENEAADPEASFGHRRGNAPGQRDEVFFGYFAQLATMVDDEGGPEVPELVRRASVSSCHVDPPPAFLPVLVALPSAGIDLGDVLCDSGYAHRVATHWALPLRSAGASLVMDLHPHDRGPQGTYEGAVISNGSLFCPATPEALLSLGPPARDASRQDLAAHDERSAEAEHYRLGRVSADDTDGYHRRRCPALSGKLRCALRPASMALDYDRPEVLAAPEYPPACCEQQTITVPPSVAAKTSQKHPYPSAAWRRSYSRRTAVERSNSTIKDPATTDIGRGWCRIMGLAPLAVFLACALVVRNFRVTDAFDARQADADRRRRAGLPPRTRRRRRTTISDLLVGSSAPP